jgi:ABC-type sugar transport system permease subunit
MAPAALIFGLFVFYPLGRTVWLGFHREDPFGNNRQWVGTEQYTDVLGSADFRHSLWVTLLFALITVPFGLILGVGLAVLAEPVMRGIAIFRTIFSSTVATSVAVASLMWFTLFNPTFGVFNALLEQLGRDDPVRWLDDPSTALWAVSASTVWQNLGLVFIVMIAALQSVPPELHEAAKVDGHRAFSRFRNITLPMLSPTLLFATVVLTINAFQSFGQIDLLTSGGPDDATNVIVYDIFTDVFENQNAGRASAKAVVLFAILLVLTLVQWRALNRRVNYS